MEQAAKLAAYKNLIRTKIRQEWELIETKKFDKQDISTIITIQLDENGGIVDIAVTQSSENKLFDESVLQAIRRAQPLPLPPDEFADAIKDGIELVFEP
jgi:TonB family protein